MTMVTNQQMSYAAIQGEQALIKGESNNLAEIEFAHTCVQDEAAGGAT